MRRDATATGPTAKSLELPSMAYTNGGTKLESTFFSIKKIKNKKGFMINN
jgi:hypothetical protein